MVKVGDFWIDRYESAVVSADYFNGGRCDGAGTIYGGATAVDDYPSTFPDNGQFTAPVYACSVSGEVPSRWVTWFQAQQACLLAGKRLCSNEEWQAAVAGTNDPGAFGSAGGACHTIGGDARATGRAGATPGGSTSFIGRWGAEDLIGNLWEWVGDWQPSGRTWQTQDLGLVNGWPQGYSADNSDRTWSVNGRTLADDDIGYVDGLPSAMLRGGSWGHGADCGAFAVNMDSAPSRTRVNFGSRCCAR
jgi:formylglycine-generating enzyme required for sulfatase activity